jgi:hypothetical protein
LPPVLQEINERETVSSGELAKGRIITSANVLHGQLKSESEMFPVAFGVEYLSGKLLPLTVESWEFDVSQRAASSVQ